MNWNIVHQMKKSFLMHRNSNGQFDILNEYLRILRQAEIRMRRQ